MNNSMDTSSDIVHSDEEYDANLQRLLENNDVTLLRKIVYGVGHFYNDLCASMWFTYLMIYLEKVLNFRSSRAGLIMLIGQMIDAISTPLIGIASDSSILPSCFNKVGKRLSWHIFGSICVSISFPFLFNRCLLCNEDSPNLYELLWYIPFVTLFQFGWASVQISHLALIPDLSSVSSTRSTLNSIRYAFTVIANLSVFFMLAWFLKEDTEGKVIGPWDYDIFRRTALIIVGGGILVNIVFYIIVREPNSGRRISRQNSSSETSSLLCMHWTSWFGYLQFYQIAFLYMVSRLCMNISQVYFPFYITITQNYSKSYVAIFPMVSYLSSFHVSMLIGTPWLNNYINKKALFLFGIICGLSNCVWMLFNLPGWQMYAVAVLIGITQAILLIISLSITTDLISKNTESCAFVYGAMSFLDKSANGIAYQLIEIWNSTCDSGKPQQECGAFYRIIMVYLPGGCLILALIILISLLPTRIGRRRTQRLMSAHSSDDLISENIS